MKQHLNTIRELNNRLTTLNSKVPDELLAVILLHSLNPSWTSVVQNLSTSSSLTFQSACLALNEEATRRKTESNCSNQSVNTALYTGNNRTTSRGYASNQTHQSRNKQFCNYCGRDGTIILKTNVILKEMINLHEQDIKQMLILLHHHPLQAHQTIQVIWMIWLI